MTPVPYSINHMPGIRCTKPACHSANVSAAPVNIGGTKLKTNFRAGADHVSRPAARALRCIAIMPIATATTPSTSQSPASG